MKRRDFACLVITTTTLSGCGLFGGDDPPPPPPPAPPPPPQPAAIKKQPTVVSLTLRAGKDVNLDSTGLPKPVEVTIYQLKGGDVFSKADFFGMDAALGSDLVMADRLMLSPGRTEVYQRKVDDDARYFGVAAAYHDIDNVEWRALYEVARDQTTFMNVILDEEGVTLKKPGL